MLQLVSNDYALCQVVLFFALSSGNVSARSTFRNETNATLLRDENEYPTWPGYIGAVIAVLFFGTTYVPVKRYNTGDGMFYQWVFCSAIWFCGLLINCIQNFPTFYPLAMTGGAMFAFGNICVVPIVRMIGMALGMLIWCSVNLLAGWTSGRFGIFGISPSVPNNTTLNYISIGFALLSTLIWFFVQPESVLEQDKKETGELKDETECKEMMENNTTSPKTDKLDLSLCQKKFVGVTLSVISGCLYGLSFTPVLYIKDKYEGASQRDIDYVFAHFCGIYATSTVIFIFYCGIKKNKPKVISSAILPGFLSGLMWAIADASWFFTNEFLSPAVSFPIITTGPGIIASLWGVVVFKEIKGQRNFVLMSLAYTITLVAAVLAGLSLKMY